MLAGLRIRFGPGVFGPSVGLGREVAFSVTDGARLRVGGFSYFDSHVRLVAKRGELLVGERAFIGVGSVLVARCSIVIGNDALIGEYVSIRDQDHRVDDGVIFARSGFQEAPIVIGDNVWLGAKVTVLKGVTIGSNVVVGANSVVTHDLPDNCVAVGAPARVVRQLKAG